jgi:hypothetical protein
MPPPVTPRKRGGEAVAGSKGAGEEGGEGYAKASAAFFSVDSFPFDRKI